MAIAADGSKEGASLPCCSLWRVDAVRQCAAGRGVVWTGGAGQSCRQQHGGLMLSLLLSMEGADMVGSGQMRLGRLGFGWVRLDRAIVADGSTEGLGSPC